VQLDPVPKLKTASCCASFMLLNRQKISLAEEAVRTSALKKYDIYCPYEVLLLNMVEHGRKRKVQ
jgi:hypothetical protein